MIRTVIRLAGGLALLGTLLVAGAHSFYYLFYWEWVRAQLAMTALVAVLVIGATVLILQRADRLERDLQRRLDDLEAKLRAASEPAPAQPSPPAPAPASGPDFPWLDPSFAPVNRGLLPVGLAAIAVEGLAEPRTSVFIPVLLGAGLIVSVLAGLVERVAAAVTNGAPGRRETPAQPRSRRQRVVRLAAGAVVVAVFGGVGTAGLFRGAHYWERPLEGGRTELVVRVESKTRVPSPPAETVELLGRYCARNAISGVRVERVEPRTPDTALLVVSPLLDEQAQRRYGGCLEDGVLFRHRLTVTGATLVPSP
jgi:hypothetical protein